MALILGAGGDELTTGKAFERKKARGGNCPPPTALARQADGMKVAVLGLETETIPIMWKRMEIKRVTLRDVAERVGVSHVTISLALRNHPSIPVRRRDEVKRVAKQVGH